MSPSEFQESVDQFVASWRSFTQLKSSGAAVEEPGLTLCFGDMAWPLMNVAFLQPVRDEADWERRARAARDYFQRRRRAWTLVTCEDWLTEAGRAALARQGLKPLMTVTGMAAGELAPPVRPLPRELSIRRVEDREGRLAVLELNATCYAVPMAWGHEIAEHAEPLWNGPRFAHVGYMDGKPVTVSATTRQGDVLYVGWVATLPEHRQKGYAEAVIRHSLGEASRLHGIRRTVLHATPAGFPVYQRMGYRPVTRFVMFGEG